MTVRLKITLLITAAGVLSSLVFSLITLWEMMEQPFDLIDAELKTVARRAVQHANSRSAILPYPDQEHYWLHISEPGANDTLYRSWLAKQFSISDLPTGKKAVIRRVAVPDSLDYDQDAGGKVAFRLLRSPATLYGKAVLITVARPIEDLEEELWDTVEDVAEGLALSVLLLLVASYIAAGIILKPIRILNQQARDISERHLERRLPVTDGRDEFNALARTLNQVFDRLQHAFLRQKSLIADASHELKTPLTMMRLTLDNAQEELDDAENETVKDNHQRDLGHHHIGEQVLRMERLVKSLLDLSSLESEAAVKRDAVDLAAMFASLLDDYRFLAEPRGIRIESDLPPQLSIQGDAERLYRAFSNLLDNAIKYNVDGGEIKLTAGQTLAGVTISISNTGPGIPKGEESKVFEQFYRVDKSRSVKYGGSGLGLAIVKRIIELHGGRVWLESTDGCTMVHISLPHGNISSHLQK